jgi:hypothetical protein
MLNINRLQLTLPSAYQHHTSTIVDRVGQLLADTDHHSMKSTDVLSVPVVRMHQGASVEDVAVAIANGIKSTMGGLSQ